MLKAVCDYRDNGSSSSVVCEKEWFNDSFFEPQDSYSQDATCQFEERNGTVTSDISDSVTLYPYPTTESFVLRMGMPFEKGQIQVFNSQGVLVRSLNLSGASTNIPVSDLPEGVY